MVIKKNLSQKIPQIPLGHYKKTKDKINWNIGKKKQNKASKQALNQVTGTENTFQKTHRRQFF